MTTTPPESSLPGGDAPYQAGQPAVTAPAPSKRRPLLWALPIAGVVLVVVITAAAVTTLSGGGAQPDTVIPSSAIAYVRMDIDPSAGQKIAAVRLFDKLPAVKDLDGKGDPREQLFAGLKKDTSDLSDVDYDKDVKPWLGERFALGILPAASGTDPVPVLAVQVTDEDKAKVGIARLTKGSKEQSDVSFRDGYALISEKGKGGQITSALAKGNLTTNERYSGDMDDLGEQGVLSGWVDIAAAGKLASGDTSTPAAVEDAYDKAGRAAFALRFEADYLELAGIGRGAESVKKLNVDETPGLTKLPDTTALALSVPGGDALVDTAWKQVMDATAGLGGGDMQSQIDQVEQQFDVKLPEDLKTLLGKRLLVALPEQDFAGDVPEIGVRVTTDAAKAESIIAKIEKVAADSGQELPLEHKAAGGTFYLATTRAYLDALSSDGKLGESKSFSLAVPNDGTEQFAAYVDLDKVEKLYLDEVPSDQRDFVQALRSVGLSGSVTADGESEFRLRLVGN